MMPGYVIEHEGRQFDPDGRVDVVDVEAHNRAIEAAELAFWQTKPERFVAYITLGIATTWKGVKIGCVISVSQFRNNLTGSRMEHVRIAGTNGATYHGTYGSDWRQMVRLRRCK